MPTTAETTKSDLLPSLQFNSDDYRPSDRLDAMNAFSQGLYHYSPLPGLDAQAPMLRLKAWSLDRIAAASFENSPIKATSCWTSDAASEDHLFLRVIRSGSVAAASDETEALLLPGSIHLMHPRNHLRPSEAGSVFSLRLPVESVGYDPLRHPRFLSFATDGWAGRTVDTAVKTLFETLPQMTKAEAEASEPMITSLVRALLSSVPLDDQAYSAVAGERTKAMRRYLLTNIRDENLDCQRMQTVFKTSRATVYRAFEDVGGISRFVREAKLNEIYGDLAEMTPERGAVRRISEKYGFFDQTTFVRAFRSFFGMRPSEVIGTRIPTKPKVTDPVAISGPTLAAFWS